MASGKKFNGWCEISITLNAVKSTLLAEPLVIAPGKRNPASLFAYRDLLFLLVRIEYLTKIQQTKLGPLWFLLQPLLMAGAFVGVFTKIIHWDVGGVSPVLFYLSGLLNWGYFSPALAGVASSLASYAPLYRKTAFPRLILPLSVLLAKLIPFALQLSLFLLAFVVLERGRALVALLLLPLTLLGVLLPLGAAALGAGLTVAALSVRYRDLQHALSFLLQLGLYASPVVYSASALAEPYRSLLFLNPVAGAIGFFRHQFFGSPLELAHYALSCLTAAAVLLFGLASFEKIEGRFVDTL